MKGAYTRLNQVTKQDATPRALKHTACETIADSGGYIEDMQ